MSDDRQIVRISHKGDQRVLVYAPGLQRPLEVGEAQAARQLVGHADLLAACEAWVAYFDLLEAEAEPGDKMAEMRRQFHAGRVEATRAAIRKAKGEPPIEEVRADLKAAGIDTTAAIDRVLLAGRRTPPPPEG